VNFSRGDRQKGGRQVAGPPFWWFHPSEGLRLVMLFTVAVVVDVACALQRDFI